MTSIREQSCFIQKSQAFEAPINRFNDRDYKDPLRLNKSRSSKAPTKSEAFAGPSWAPLPPEAPDIVRYMQKDMDHLLQTFLQASKVGFRDKLKAKTLDVYRNRFYMECYNFCQQCKDYFATYGATGPNRIPLAAFFL